MVKKLSSFFEEPTKKKCPTKQSVEKKCQIVSVKKCNDLKEKQQVCKQQNDYNPRKNPIDFLMDYHEHIVSHYELVKKGSSSNEQKFLDDMSNRAWDTIYKYKKSFIISPKQQAWIQNIMKRYYGE